MGVGWEGRWTDIKRINERRKGSEIKEKNIWQACCVLPLPFYLSLIGKIKGQNSSETKSTFVIRLSCGGHEHRYGRTPNRVNFFCML